MFLSNFKMQRTEPKLHSFLTAALDEDDCHFHTSAVFIPGKEPPDITRINNSVGPKTNMNVIAKIKITPLPGIVPQTSSPQSANVIPVNLLIQV